jgi:hypothetical protein
VGLGDVNSIHLMLHMLPNYLPKVNPTSEIYNLLVLQNGHIPATLEMCGRQLARGEFICKCARKEEN